MYPVCSTWVSEEMLKGVQDANVCLWNTQENFTTAYKSNLIFHLNPCTSDIRGVDIHSAPVLSSHSHWLLLHEISVTAEPLSLQHHDHLVLIQVWVPSERGVSLAVLPQLCSAPVLVEQCGEHKLADALGWFSCGSVPKSGSLCSHTRISACTGEEITWSDLPLAAAALA